MPSQSSTDDASLTAYRNGDSPLPPTFRRWHLYGAGLANVGRDGQAETVTRPEPGPDEILVRHDACGICYSDIKIITLGANHPRLVGRDLVNHPVVMGHEVALTVVNAGANNTERFTPGQRFIVQADVYYKGRNLAYGYLLSGGMAQYGLVGPEVLDGDEGCYLLPIEDSTGYAEAALVEPWACVEAAYHWHLRSDPDPTGDYLLVPTALKPRLAPDPDGRRVLWLGDGDPADAPHGAGYADIFFSGNTPAPSSVEAACRKLGRGGVAHIHFDGPLARPVALDVGRIHYDAHGYIGSTPNDRCELLPGGTAWFVGAAGPMGQMHVQRALQLPSPPARLICTDRNTNRLDALAARLGPMAQAAGVELLLFDVRENGPPPHAALAPTGYDDIVVMVPSVEAIEEAWPLLGRNGVLNIFAGIARGTTANLDISRVATDNCRIVGTSGSSIGDMRRTRDSMEAHTLDTGASLAAIGGLDAFRDGLEAVQTGRFPGKTVIFPQITLPLTALADLATVRPRVFALLKDGQFWTAEAEAELLRESLAGGG